MEWRTLRGKGAPGRGVAVLQRCGERAGLSRQDEPVTWQSPADTEGEKLGWEFANRRVMLVAIGPEDIRHGLQRLDRLAIADLIVVVTIDRPEARTALVGRAVSYIDAVDADDRRLYFIVARALMWLVASRRPDVAIVVGAVGALAAWPAARRHRVRLHYIEDAGESSGPGLAERVLRLLPGVTTWDRRDHPQSEWRGSTADESGLSSRA